MTEGHLRLLRGHQAITTGIQLPPKRRQQLSEGRLLLRVVEDTEPARAASQRSRGSSPGRRLRAATGGVLRTPAAPKAPAVPKARAVPKALAVLKALAAPEWCSSVLGMGAVPLAMPEAPRSRSRQASRIPSALVSAALGGGAL